MWSCSKSWVEPAQKLIATVSSKAAKPPPQHIIPLEWQPRSPMFGRRRIEMFQRWPDPWHTGRTHIGQTMRDIAIHAGQTSWSAARATCAMPRAGKKELGWRLRGSESVERFRETSRATALYQFLKPPCSRRCCCGIVLV